MKSKSLQKGANLHHRFTIRDDMPHVETYCNFRTKLNHYIDNHVDPWGHKDLLLNVLTWWAQRPFQNLPFHGIVPLMTVIITFLQILVHMMFMMLHECVPICNQWHIVKHIRAKHQQIGNALQCSSNIKGHGMHNIGQCRIVHLYIMNNFCKALIRVVLRIFSTVWRVNSQIALNWGFLLVVPLSLIGNFLWKF